MSTGSDIHRSAKPEQIVCLKVEGRAFGIPVEQVREIKGWQPATAIPDVPASVLGVINLRGQIIAIHDLRMRLGLDASEVTRSSVIIVVETAEQKIGLLADAVSDILDLAAEQFRPAPTEGDEDPLVESLVVRREGVIPLLRVKAIAQP